MNPPRPPANLTIPALLFSTLLLISLNCTRRNDQVAIIPRPVSLEIAEGVFLLDKDTIITADEDSTPLADRLSTLLVGGLLDCSH